FVQRESMTGPQIAEVKYELLDRVVGMFECGSDCEAFPMVEETEKDATSRRSARLIDQSELAPRERRCHPKIHCFALDSEFAAPANFRIIPFRFRIDEPQARIIQVPSRVDIIEAKSS